VKKKKRGGGRRRRTTVYLMSQLVSSVLEAYLFQFLNWYHMFFRHNVKDLAIAIHEVVEGVLPGCG
jgi:hypothetical protein